MLGNRRSKDKGETALIVATEKCEITLNSSSILRLIMKRALTKEELFL